jgi:hypothetical protein
MLNPSDLAQAATDLAASVDANHVGTGLIVAAFTSELIEMAKNSGIKILSWIGTDTAGVNRLVGGVIAFLTGLGIGFSYDHTTGTLVINGLVASSISHGVIQWVQQQLYYRLVIAKGALAAPPAQATQTLTTGYPKP